MAGQGLALWMPLRLVWLGCLGARVIGRCFRRTCDLFFFERQFKLIEGFGCGAKPMAAQSGELMFEFLDEKITAA